MLSHRSKLRLVNMAAKYLDKLGNVGFRHSQRSGISSGFFKFTESFGVKIVKDGLRDSQMLKQVEIYNRAVDCHAIGCAPYTFGMFYHNHFGLCYIVYCGTTFYDLGGKFGNYYSSHAFTREGKLGKTVNCLSAKMYYKAGFCFTDAHNNNLAKMPDGSIVCIDFDQFTYLKSQDDLRYYGMNRKGKEYQVA